VLGEGCAAIVAIDPWSALLRTPRLAPGALHLLTERGMHSMPRDEGGRAKTVVYASPMSPHWRNLLLRPVSLVLASTYSKIVES
jgi:hypothetical protein